MVSGAMASGAFMYSGKSSRSNLTLSAAARESVAQMTGGNGGGRAESATAGGKNIEKVDEALDLVSTLV